MPNRIYVDNPDPSPFTGGLLSAVTEVPVGAHWANGVDFLSEACATAHPWPDPCGTSPPPESFEVSFTGIDQFCDIGFNLYATVIGDPGEVTPLWVQTIVSDLLGDNPACAEGTVGTFQIDSETPVPFVAIEAGTNHYEVIAEVEYGSTHTWTAVVNGQTFTEEFTVGLDGNTINAAGTVEVYTGTVVTLDATVNPGQPHRDILVTFGAQGPITYNTGDAPLALDPVEEGSHAIDVEDVDTADTEASAFVVGPTGCEPDCVQTVTFSADSPEEVIPMEKEFDDGILYDTGEPFTLYHGFACKLLDTQEARGIIARRFAYAEPRALEHVFWTGDAGNYPALATDPNLVVLATVATDIVQALALLEQEISETYGGVATIHAPRQAGPYAAESHLIVQDGPRLRTPLGSLWAFGAGYDPTIGPTGETEPTTSQVWMYATGQVTARRGQVMIVPEGGNTIDRVTNETTVLAERTWVLTRDCLTIAVLVTLQP